MIEQGFFVTTEASFVASSLEANFVLSSGSRSFSVLPSASERTQGIQRIFKGFLLFFFGSAVAVEDFSSTR